MFYSVNTVYIKYALEQSVKHAVLIIKGSDD